MHRQGFLGILPIDRPAAEGLRFTSGTAILMPNLRLGRRDAMIVCRMDIEHFVETNPDGEEIEVHSVANPKWSTIESAICALDGIHRSTILLYVHPESAAEDFEINGGDGTYFMLGSIAGSRFVHVDEDQCCRSLTFRAGWGEYSWPRKFCLFDVERVVDATRYFCDNGRFDHRLSWRKHRYC